MYQSSWSMLLLVVLHFFANTHSRKPILISPWIYGHMLYTCILFDKIKYICVYLEDEATCSVYAMYFKTMTIYLIWRSRVLVISGVKCISPIPLQVQVCDKHTTYILTRLAKYAVVLFLQATLFLWEPLCLIRWIMPVDMRF